MTDVYPPEDPRYKMRWVLAPPRIDPPIARACMAAPVPWPVRLARQVIPRAHIRDCCWPHSIDWRKASAVAIRLARRLNREHIAERTTGTSATLR